MAADTARVTIEGEYETVLISEAFTWYHFNDYE